MFKSKARQTLHQVGRASGLLRIGKKNCNEFQPKEKIA